MGWEHRGNQLYYYRKKREGRRVVSEYIGSGMSAHLIAELDNEDERARAYSAVKWKEQRSEIEKIDNAMNQLEKSINGFVRAVFLTSGYHAHKGQWRQARNG